ncbi:MAG: ribonuclease P protein component [Deltaproteobacteria bacterium]|nr:ribonuclease P protein component [Candidatus Zymogenaceae bacterium]
MPQMLIELGEKISVDKKTFTKRDRIKNKSDFERLKRSGIKFTDGVFLTVILANDLGFCRLGIAVPKRVGNAVARNKIKRLIREVFRLNRESLPGSIDLLVVVRRPPDNLDLGEFHDRIFSLTARYRADGYTGRSTRGGQPDG